MATTVERPTKIDERTPAAGGGPWRVFYEDGNLHLVLDRRSPHPSSTAVYVALAGIGMIFAALTSATGSAQRWGHGLEELHASFHSLPEYPGTFGKWLCAGNWSACGWKVHDAPEPRARQANLLVLSDSWLWDWCLSPDNTLRGCNFAVKACISRQTRAVRSSTCLRLRTPSTCWVDLEDWYSSSRRLQRLTLQKSTLNAVSRYWHFMDALWIYLLCLLWFTI